MVGALPVQKTASSVQEVARHGYKYGTWVMLVVIIVQFLAAGAGLFSISASQPQGATGVSILQYHGQVGPAIVFFLSIIMVILGFAGRLPWRMTGVAASFIPLLILQSVFILPYKYQHDMPALAGMPWLAGLHVLNALFIFWLTFQWVEWTRRDLAALRK